MRNNLLWGVALVGLMSGGVIWLGESGAAKGQEVVEQQVHADLVRVRIRGQWEEFPLVPLADDLCRSGDHLFRRYCRDRVFVPGSR